MMKMSVRGTYLVLGSLVAGAVSSVQGQVPTDTYQQTCELPPFEWAAYGTRVTGRMYTRRAAMLGVSLFAAGYLKSTSAPNEEEYQPLVNDFGVTGPYTASDPTGTNGDSVTVDLTDYTTEFGSFAQYEVGVVKINAASGSPEDIYVYYGEGQDETCGLAAKEISSGEEVLAISGHFVGTLTADHSDGTSTTIFNSNSNGTADYVQHPNAVKNGFDDGFVISADAATGDANWLVAYPTSTKDAQTVGVDIDNEGNIFGAGYSCNLLENGEDTVCDGFVAKFNKTDGSVVWENIMTDLAAAMWIVYDETDNALYVTGTTTYKGDGSDGKIHESCNHDTCAVTMRLSASDGTIDWVRTVQGSPRWNFFDQTGDIRLASESDGPYIYVALDDAGENGVVSMDEGTPYAGCLSADGALSPEYQISGNTVVTAEDCLPGSTFVSRDAANAMPAADAVTGAVCGAGHEASNTCIMKYNKYSGYPIWGSDTPPVASLVPSPDGQSVTAVGFYWLKQNGANFDSVLLPDYNGIEGAFNAKLNAVTGEGEYVMHSGGVGKNRPYDAVGDSEGNVYIVGYTLSNIINWGGTLETLIIEEGGDEEQEVAANNAGVTNQMGGVPSKSGEYQFFAVKLLESQPATPTCVESCSLMDSIANPVIKAGTCLIDNHCYQAGHSAAMFGRPCLVCNPAQSQTEWSLAPSIGNSICFIDNICRDTGDPRTFRESRSVTHVSECQFCDPGLNGIGWSVKPEYELTGEELPNDCANKTMAPADPIQVTGSPTLAPIAAPTVPDSGPWQTRFTGSPTVARIAAPTVPVSGPLADPIQVTASPTLAQIAVPAVPVSSLSGGAAAGTVVGSVAGVAILLCAYLV